MLKLASLSNAVEIQDLTCPSKVPCCTPAAWVWALHFQGNNGNTGPQQRDWFVDHNTLQMSTGNL